MTTPSLTASRYPLNGDVHQVWPYRKAVRPHSPDTPLFVSLETLEERRKPGFRQLIDPGIGTALAPVAAVSSGLVPQPLMMSASSSTGYLIAADKCKTPVGRIDLEGDPGYLSQSR
jgi:hypothetical protein